jgi:hypothetical protein
MAYVSKDTKAIIAANIKPLLKKYGVKATLAVRHHSTIVLNIKSGPIDFIENYLADGKCGDETWVRRHICIDVNPYWFHEHFTGVAKKFLTEAMTALKSANWYDKTDTMIDYFDTAYYVDINIGKWDRAYELVK